MKMGEMSSFQLGVVGALFLSVASSVSIVICNKALMSNLGFPFGTPIICFDKEKKNYTYKLITSNNINTK